MAHSSARAARWARRAWVARCQRCSAAQPRCQRRQAVAWARRARCAAEAATPQRSRRQAEAYHTQDDRDSQS
jgi:hypothetical protein